MPSKRALLIRRLEERLIPAFVAMGFDAIPLYPDEQKGSELRFAFPLGRLKRIKNGNFELIEIQLDKHGGAKFRLNFGVLPPEGIDHPIKHVAQGEACVQFLSHYCELCSWPFFMKWFAVPASIFSDNYDVQVCKVVERVVGLVPEVETWFATGKVGPHVRQVGKS